MRMDEVYGTNAARRKRKRVGRGSGSGTGKTAGRGAKGQRARAGFSRRAFFEGGQMPLFRRIPKRGFNNANFEEIFALVNVRDLKCFNPNDDVTVEALRAKGLVKKAGKRVKLLGEGDMDRPLVVRVHKFSASAREKIEKAGGTVETI